MAQLHDSFDGGRPRLVLDSSDCSPRIVHHEVTLRGGRGDSPAERLALQSGRGTEALFIYPLSPAAVIDELAAHVWLRASRPGIRIGFRVVFPESLNEAVGEPFQTVLWGDSYLSSPQSQNLTVADINSKLNVRVLAMRSEHGADHDFSRPYVDAVVLNAYAGPGRTELLIDELQLEGQVPYQFRRTSSPSSPSPASRRSLSPFPKNRIRRIVEHRGESFRFLKSLGFDTVLLAEPISVERLREADQADVDLIGPPCPYALPVADTLRRRIVAYVLSGRLAGDALPMVQQQRTEIAALPQAWQRPLIVSPLERIPDFAASASCLIADLPPPTRGLSGAEHVTILRERQQLAGPGVDWIVAIDSESPRDLQRQLAAIAESLQIDVGSHDGWHHQVTRAFHALSGSPRGILFRSSRSLESETDQDRNRGSVMRIVNRMLHAIEPIAAGGYVGSALECGGTSHRAFAIQNGPYRLLIAVQADADGSYSARGDSGRVLDIVPPQAFLGKNSIRITDGGNERIGLTPTPQGPRLQIISPDLVELVVSTDSQALPAELRSRLGFMATDAGHARWELVAEDTIQTRTNWLSAAATGAVRREDIPVRKMTAAMETLENAERLFGSGRINEALRLTRRADAWQRAARAALTKQLMPPGPGQQSLPTLQSPNGLALHLTWPPNTTPGSWQERQLPQLAIEDASEMTASGWRIDQRIPTLAETSVQVSNAAPANGRGALMLTSQAVPGQVVSGGYAGTSLRVQSPPIPVTGGRWLQIDVQVRTGLGFGGPDQGLLVYDSLGGPTLGVLVRETEGWQQIRLYRYAREGAEPLRFMAEVSGTGEVWLDDLRVREWTVESGSTLPFRPLRTAVRPLASPTSGN